MDRDRLKEVHQTDLTESRVNEDFLDWLKSKGPTWLLVILTAVCVYLATVRFKQSRVNHHNEAWAAYFEAELPGAFEDVAREFGDVGQLANASRLRAGGRLLRSVQTGLALGAAAPDVTGAPTPDERLSPEERTQFLTRAEGLFDDVLATDTGDHALTLYAVQALTGKAAIAESRGDRAAAKDAYEAAAARAESFYPGLAAQARQRAESTTAIREALTFRSAAEIAGSRVTPPTPTPPAIDPALRELIMPGETGG